MRHAALSLLILLLVSCSSAAPSTDNLQPGSVTVSPYFQPFYDSHGGARLLGEPISGEVDDNGVIVQYFQNAKLEYHPQLPPGNQILMASLAKTFYGLSPCVPPTGVQPNALYFNECHSVSPEFRGFFEQHGGVAFFGYPISERYIFKNSLAQDFERATLIWDSNRPVEYQFGLLPLGVLACPPSTCESDIRSAIVVPPVSTPTPAIQTDAISRFFAQHGGSRVFGLPLTGVRIAADGTREQVYENAILYEDLSAAEGIRLRPLGVQMLGAPEFPAPPLNGPNTGYYTKYGHNISYAIYDFYNTYGGEPVFGQPVSEWRIVDNHFVQYFENVVLTVQFNLPPDQTVQLVDLGRQAITAQTDTAPRDVPPQLLIVATEPLHDILLNPETDQQTLTVRVLDETGLPVAGADVKFVVHTPRGDMALVGQTNPEGYASYSFRLTSYKSGDFMLYDVSVAYGTLTSTATGSFVTWGVLVP